MATSNKVVNKQWTRLTEGDTADFLISPNTTIEVAVTETTASPGSNSGHLFSKTFSRFNDGYIWGRLQQSERKDSLIAVVTEEGVDEPIGLFTSGGENFITSEGEIFVPS